MKIDTNDQQVYDMLYTINHLENASQNYVMPLYIYQAGYNKNCQK